MYWLQPPQQPQVGARYTVTTVEPLSSVVGWSVAAVLQALNNRKANIPTKINLLISLPHFSISNIPII
jgi:hypothetical protein